MTRAPLSGITVVTLEQAVSAPMCTRTLADFGARVIKIEHPNGGDFARHYDDVVNGLAAHFVWCNRNKESVTIDVKTTEGLDILHRLLDRADVLVSNLAPGSTGRLGITPADVEVRTGTPFSNMKVSDPDVAPIGTFATLVPIASMRKPIRLPFCAFAEGMKCAP